MINGPFVLAVRTLRVSASFDFLPRPLIQDLSWAVPARAAPSLFSASLLGISSCSSQDAPSTYLLWFIYKQCMSMYDNSFGNNFRTK